MDINSSSSSYQNLLAMLGKNVSSSINTASNSGNSVTSNDSVSSSPSSPTRSLQLGKDKVSISLHADKLSRITKEFFSGTMSSSDIPALTQRLFKDGFISASEFQSLGGKEDDISTINQASNFLNTYIANESVDGDSEAAKEILNIINVIDRMDESITPKQRQAEVNAFDFATSYTEKLKDSGTSEDVIAGFENVVDVLSALNKVRSDTFNGNTLNSQEQIASPIDTYTSIQQTK